MPNKSRPNDGLTSGGFLSHGVTPWGQTIVETHGNLKETTLEAAVHQWDVHPLALGLCAQWSWVPNLHLKCQIQPSTNASCQDMNLIQSASFIFSGLLAIALWSDELCTANDAACCLSPKNRYRPGDDHVQGESENRLERNNSKYNRYIPGKATYKPSPSHQHFHGPSMWMVYDIALPTVLEKQKYNFKKLQATTGISQQQSNNMFHCFSTSLNRHRWSGMETAPNVAAAGRLEESPSTRDTGDTPKDGEIFKQWKGCPMSSNTPHL